MLKYSLTFATHEIYFVIESKHGIQEVKNEQHPWIARFLCQCQKQMVLEAVILCQVSLKLHLWHLETD